MSRRAMHNKLREGQSDEYSKVCTKQKVGCFHRHGPALEKGAALEFTPCPNCVAKTVAMAGLSNKETRYQRQLKRNAAWHDGLVMPYKGSK